MRQRSDWYRTDLTLDNGKEAVVLVNFQIHPSEPDVGIMSEYVELKDWKTEPPCVLTDDELDRLEQLIALEVEL